MNSALAEETHNVIEERMAYVPENYKSSAIAEVGTATVVDPQEVFSKPRKHQPIPIWRLQVKARKFYTLRPISVEVYRDEDFFFAENENLAVCGSGCSLQEALNDLCLHIIHFFEYYGKLDRTKLTGDALRLKGLYQNLLIEE